MYFSSSPGCPHKRHIDRRFSKIASGSSVGIATDYGWAVLDRIPIGTRISARPDRSWGPPSFLYNGYRVFPRGVKCGRGVLLNTHLLLVPRSWKSRAIPLPTLWVTPGPVTDHFTFTLPFLIIFVEECSS